MTHSCTMLTGQDAVNVQSRLKAVSKTTLLLVVGAMRHDLWLLQLKEQTSYNAVRTTVCYSAFDLTEATNYNQHYSFHEMMLRLTLLQPLSCDLLIIPVELKLQEMQRSLHKTHRVVCTDTSPQLVTL